MRSWLTGGLLGLAALLSGEGLAAEPVTQLAQKNGWLTDYQAARAVARRDGKPLMVVFRCQP